MTLPEQFSEKMQKIQKVDVAAFILGAMLLFFSGSILITMHVHGDLAITKGYFSVSDISLILHASVGLFLLISPLHRRVFGALSTTFAFTFILLTGYMYTQNPLQSAAGLLTLLFMDFLLLAPSLCVLFASYRIRIGSFVVGLLLAIIGWSLLFWWMIVFTDAWLVPWDTFGEAWKPAEGTWQRTVNDFFQFSYGFYLPATLATIISMALFQRQTKQKERSHSLAYLGGLYLLSTIVFVALTFALSFFYSFMGVLWLEPASSPLELGCHRNTLPTLTTIILLLALFLFQVRIGFKRSQ